MAWNNIRTSGKFYLMLISLVCLSTGAFLLLYVMLLLLIGVPLFFMELAAGQNIRQGSIGVWKHISPRLAGIGFSSCVVIHIYTHPQGKSQN